jgi:UDP-glucose 4-epimerase
MILITGGMGFIGLHTARRLLDAGEDVVITRYRTWREPDFLKDEYGKRVQIESVDTTSHHDVLGAALKHRVTGIVHLSVPALAALTPAEDYRVNTDSLINVLEAGRLAGVKRVCVASSVAVYSTGLKEGPFREDMYLPLQSSNPTETWKKAEEIMGQHYATRTGMEVVFMRIGGIYGPLYHSMANLPSRMTHAAVKGVPVNYGGGPRGGGVPCEEDGGDICYVKDCALGIQLLTMAETLNHRVYNVSGGVTVTNRQLASAVRQAVPGAQVELRAGKGPGWRPHNYLDITRLTADTGYKPQYTVETAIADYVAWLRSGHKA